MVEQDTLLNTKLLNFNIKVRPYTTNRTRHYTFKDKESLNVVISNLISCIRKGSKLVYSRRIQKAPISKRKITLYRIVKATDWLEKEGYIHNHIGTASKDPDYRKVSYMEPTEKFLTEYTLKTEHMQQTEEDYLNTVPVIELRDKEKKTIPYKETEHIKEMEAIIRSLNAFNDQHSVKDREGTPLTNVYCRVFNQTFQQGGRFYRADVLSIKNKDNNARLDITIDNHPVVEVDYCNLHFRIASVLDGIPLNTLEDIPIDIYTGILEDESNKTERKIVKLAVNMMFNCTNNIQAQRAIQQEINRLSREEREVYTLGTAKDVISLIRKEYKAFEHRFCTEDSFGRTLQYIDSQIANSVIQYMMSLNVPVFPVHDSFIVPYEWKGIGAMDKLCDAMGDGFREVLDTDVLVPLGIKYKDEEKLIDERIIL